MKNKIAVLGWYNASASQDQVCRHLLWHLSCSLPFPGGSVGLTGINFSWQLWMGGECSQEIKWWWDIVCAQCPQPLKGTPGKKSTVVKVWSLIYLSIHCVPYNGQSPLPDALLNFCIFWDSFDRLIWLFISAFEWAWQGMMDSHMGHAKVDYLTS